MAGAGPGAKNGLAVSVEGRGEALPGAFGAAPALFGDTQLYAKIAEPASAAGDRGFDVSFGDGAADADAGDAGFDSLRDGAAPALVGIQVF